MTNHMINMPLTRILLLFYMLIGTSLLQPLLSKQWISTIKNDRIIQHIIGFTTILTLAILVCGGDENYEETNISNLIMYSIIAYIWFLFLTKMDIHFNIMIIVLLLGNYMYDNHIKAKNKKILKDNILSEDIKNHLLTQNHESGNYAMFSIMALIVGGMFMYSEKKEVQHGGGYSFVNFLLY